VIQQKYRPEEKMKPRQGIRRIAIIIVMSLFAWGIFVATATVADDAPSTFREAKRLLVDIYKANPKTFYCDCEYVSLGRKLSPLNEHCKYISRKPKDTRYNRVEWEHVMPASWLGRQRQCWKDGGRKNCRKHDLEFNRMEADMVNLVPSNGEINRDRSNYRFGSIYGEERQYGACDFEVDNKRRVAEPRAGIRGNIARTMLFMRDRYEVTLSPSQTKLYAAWNKQDPIDEWERTRDEKILAVQGHSNHYITKQQREQR